MLSPLFAVSLEICFRECSRDSLRTQSVPDFVLEHQLNKGLLQGVSGNLLNEMFLNPIRLEEIKPANSSFNGQYVFPFSDKIRLLNKFGSKFCLHTFAMTSDAY